MRLFVASLVAILPVWVFLGLVVWERSINRRRFKTPLTAYLLRPPGESLRLRMERMDEKIHDLSLGLFSCSILFGFGAWSYWVSPIVGDTILVLTLLVFIFFTRRFQNLVRDRRDFYLGFLGERAVGEELNSLLADGWRVFHDIEFDEKPGSSPFNVDHVVVGTGGIFAIETKTRRKRVLKSKNEPPNAVTFDGTALEYPWGRETFGISNASDRAEYLSKWLTQKLQTPCPVVPVLALPGWSVTRKSQGVVKVVSGREVCQVFRRENEKSVIDPNTVRAIIGMLDQKCRDVGRDLAG